MDMWKFTDDLNNEHESPVNIILPKQKNKNDSIDLVVIDDPDDK